VLDNLPIKPIEKKCNILIGSFVNPVGYEESPSGLISIAIRTFMLDQAKEALDKSKYFDLLIAPAELTKFGILEIDKAEDIFEMGYKETKEKLKDPEIQEIIASLRSQ
jgi:NTE family protein